MSPARTSIAASALLACAVLLGTTACGAGDDLRRSLETTPPEPTGQGPIPTVRTAAPDPGAPAVPCTGDRLAVSIGPPSVSGDSTSQDLIFQNIGTEPCTTAGFPSVVAVAGNEGEPVGQAALPSGERGTPVRLEPRAAAVARLTVRDPSGYDASACRPQAVRGLRVAPAGGSGAAFVPRAGTACSTTPPDRPQSVIGTVTSR